MVGIGTAKVDVDAYRYNFCSILGRDSESWGLSYYGKAQEAGVFTNIAGARFGQGSIIGVHLDAWLGRVYFYKNRRPLGKFGFFDSLKLVSQVNCSLHIIKIHSVQPSELPII
jgi:SPRY domain